MLSCASPAPPMPPAAPEPEPEPEPEPLSARPARPTRPALRSCLKRTPSPGELAVRRPVPRITTPSSSSSTTSLSSDSVRTVRFSSEQVPVFATHSASEYDRRPSAVAYYGMASLLGAGPQGPDPDAPPPGTGAGDAWHKARQATEHKQGIDQAAGHPDVEDSVDAMWALGAARLMGLSPEEEAPAGAPAEEPVPSLAPTVELSAPRAQDREEAAHQEPVATAPSSATSTHARSATPIASPAPTVTNDDDDDTEVATEDELTESESDSDAAQTIFLFSLRGDENELTVPCSKKHRPRPKAAARTPSPDPSVPQLDQRITEPICIAPVRAPAPPHPEAESGWMSSSPRSMPSLSSNGSAPSSPASSTLSRSASPTMPLLSLPPVADPTRERERALLGMGPHHHVRLNRKAHAQRVCLMARFGLLDQPPPPLPGTAPRANRGPPRPSFD